MGAPVAGRFGAWGALALAAVLGVVGCGGRGGLPPELPPVVKGPDGATYLLLDRGKYKGFYDRWGRLQRIEYDSNDDGRPDVIAYHDGAKSPHQLAIDEDFDGRSDRWEDYDPQGVLQKVGLSRRHNGHPDLWVVSTPGDVPLRKDYDDDADGLVERSEIFTRGLLSRVEMDTNRDGKMDRWQDWSTGHLSSEELDTDSDGSPDRRITYGETGRVLKLERLNRGG
jgi:hypothetical protein